MEMGLFIWGFVQCFMVAILVPIVKKNVNNYLLSLVFIFTGFNILFQYLLRFSSLSYEVPELLILPDSLDMLLPPLVLIYIQNILGSDFKFIKLRYFVPPLLWISAMTGYIIFNDNFNFRSYIGTSLHAFNLSIIFSWKCAMLYTGYTFVRHRINFLSKKQKVLLPWPKILILFLGILSYIALVNVLNMLLKDPAYLSESTRATMRTLVNLNYVVFTCSIVLITIFFAFKYPKILIHPIVKQMNESDVQEVEENIKTLNALIHEQKIYLDTELNERKLAEALGVPKHVLSKILNAHMGQSFREFINHYRVKEAKRLLLDKDKSDLTAFAVAIDSGFSSESVFYVNFKKNTGYTPMQFKKNMLH